MCTVCTIYTVHYTVRVSVKFNSFISTCQACCLGMQRMLQEERVFSKDASPGCLPLHAQDLSSAVKFIWEKNVKVWRLHLKIQRLQLLTISLSSCHFPCPSYYYGVLKCALKCSAGVLTTFYTVLHWVVDVGWKPAVAGCVFLPARWRCVVISAYCNPSHFFCDPSHLPVIWKVCWAVVQYVGGTSLVLVLINFLLQPLTTCD